MTIREVCGAALDYDTDRLPHTVPGFHESRLSPGIEAIKPNVMWIKSSIQCLLPYVRGAVGRQAPESFRGENGFVAIAP